MYIVFKITIGNLIIRDLCINIQWIMEIMKLDIRKIWLDGLSLIFSALVYSPLEELP